MKYVLCSLFMSFNSFCVSLNTKWCIEAYSEGKDFFAVLFMTFALINLSALLMNLLVLQKEF